MLIRCCGECNLGIYLHTGCTYLNGKSVCRAGCGNNNDLFNNMCGSVIKTYCKTKSLSCIRSGNLAVAVNVCLHKAGRIDFIKINSNSENAAGIVGLNLTVVVSVTA